MTLSSSIRKNSCIMCFSIMTKTAFPAVLTPFAKRFIGRRFFSLSLVLRDKSKLDEQNNKASNLEQEKVTDEQESGKEEEEPRPIWFKDNGEQITEDDEEFKDLIRDLPKRDRKLIEEESFKNFCIVKVMSTLDFLFDNSYLKTIFLYRNKYIRRLKRQEKKGRKQFDILRRAILSDLENKVNTNSSKAEKLYTPQKDPTIDKGWLDPSFEEQFFKERWDEKKEKVEPKPKFGFREILKQWAMFKRYSVVSSVNKLELKFIRFSSSFFKAFNKFKIFFSSALYFFSIPDRGILFLKKIFRFFLSFFKAFKFIFLLSFALFSFGLFIAFVVCFVLPIALFFAGFWFLVNKFFFVLIPLLFHFVSNSSRLINFHPATTKQDSVNSSRVDYSGRQRRIFWSKLVSWYDVSIKQPFFNFYYKAVSEYNKYWIEVYGTFYGLRDSRDRNVSPFSWRWNETYWSKLNPYEKQYRYERITRLVVLRSLFIKLPKYYSKKLFFFVFFTVPFEVFLYLNHLWSRLLQTISLFYYGECIEYDHKNEKFRSESFSSLNSYYYHSYNKGPVGVLEGPKKPINVCKNFLGLQFFPSVVKSKLGPVSGAKSEVYYDEYDLYESPGPLYVGDGTVKKRFRKWGKPKWFDFSSEPNFTLFSDSELKSLKDLVSTAYPSLFKGYSRRLPESPKRLYSWRDDEKYYSQNSDPYPIIPLKIGIYKSRFKFLNALNRRLDELDWVNYVEIKTRAWKFRNDDPAVEPYTRDLDDDTGNYKGYWDAWRQFVKMDRYSLYKDEYQSEEEYADDRFHVRAFEWFLMFFWMFFSVCFAFVTFLTFPIVAAFQFINHATSYPVVERFLYYISYFFCFFAYTVPHNWRFVFWPLIKFMIYTRVYVPTIGWFLHMVFKPIYDYIYRRNLIQYTLIPYFLELFIVLGTIQYRIITIGAIYIILRRTVIVYTRLGMFLGYIFDFMMEIICWFHYFYVVFPQYVAPRMVKNYFGRFSFIFIDDLADMDIAQYLTGSVRFYNIIQHVLKFFFYVFLALLRYIPLVVLVWYTWYIIETNTYEAVFLSLLKVRLFFYPYPLHPYTVITFITIFYISVFRMACPPFSRFIEFEMFEIYWGTIIVFWLCFVHPELTLWGDIPYMKKLFPRLL